MKRTFAIVLSVFCALPIFGGHAASSSSSTAPKSVHVNGYVKKDGTVVNGYQRTAPPGSHKATTAQSNAPENVSSGSPTSITPITTVRAVPKAVDPHVLGDGNTHRYYRESCTAPTAAVRMRRSAAIAAGYRPDPGCYAH